MKKSNEELYLEKYFGYNLEPRLSLVVDTSNQKRRWMIVLTEDGPRFRDGLPADLSVEERREILSAAGRDFSTRPGKQRRAERARRKIASFRKE